MVTRLNVIGFKYLKSLTHLRTFLYLTKASRAGIISLLWSPGIDSRESIPPAYVAWRAGTTTLFQPGS